MLVRSPLMDRIGLLLMSAAFAASCLARAAAAQDDQSSQYASAPTDPHQSDWRDALRSQYKYIPDPRASVAVSTKAVGSVPNNSTTVISQRFVAEGREENSRKVYDSLENELVQEKQAAKQREFNKRLGIGFQGYSNGYFAAGVVTVLYVPVFVGFGFSW
jgi:hypothetical protein